MALPTLTDFLNSWDKLIVTGMTPERSDSVMTTTTNNIPVAIEYRHQINSSTGECSTIAYLVAYDENGNRNTLRNQTYDASGMRRSSSTNGLPRRWVKLAGLM